MKIICNNDVIDISKVEYVEVKDVKEYELKKLEEECNGEYTSEYLWAYLYSLDVDGAPSSAIASKIEKMLNKYW